MQNIFKQYADYLKDNPKGYWFKAKIFGWGWTPARWQGWLVLLIFLTLIVLNSLRFDLHEGANSSDVTMFFVQTVVLVAILLVICYKTGERPRWQWGVPKKQSLIDEQADLKKANLDKALAFVVSRGRVSNRELEAYLHMSEATVTRYMDELEKNGQVRQVGATGRNVFYEAVENGSSAGPR